MSKQHPESFSTPTVSQQQLDCTHFFRSSAHLHMALVSFKATSANRCRRIYRRWRNRMKALSLPPEIEFRVRYLASRAYEQAEAGECHTAAYDFRRATLMVRKALLITADFQLQEATLPHVTSPHVPLGLTPRERLQKNALRIGQVP